VYAAALPTAAGPEYPPDGAAAPLTVCGGIMTWPLELYLAMFCWLAAFSRVIDL
jgi:hypothetical protein